MADQKRLELPLRKVWRDGAEVTCGGRLFQMREESGMKLRRTPR